MADRTAKSHAHISQRARPRDAPDRKVVFKSVLANPFHVPWPTMPENVQNSILAHLMTLLDGISAFHTARDDAHRRKRKADWAARSSKKRKRNPSAGGMMGGGNPEPSTTTDASHVSNPEPATAPPLSPPVILDHLTIGINEVTKAVEQQVQRARRVNAHAGDADNPQPGAQHSPIKYVFVCRADVNPPALIAHFPQLVAACNSTTVPPTGSNPHIKIVPLPPGAETSLAAALGLRRVAVIAIDGELPGVSDMQPLLDSVPTLYASWMAGSIANDATSMEPTHIKQLRTTTPKDMRAAKEERAKGRAAAKDRKKQAKVESQKVRAPPLVP
ncbi:hypothetical protein BV25DRAFT_522987 [Artomyces pyxidatus]|uniref:Uncharacterized protein n=1 Tax=Artomyces pyxidatus TaxID=48021 RepID=A0ACB8TI21_9AGAM|nr:hypothetical protein BV25DRAFT_522987 [Artomyces pyxidatus]